MGYTTDYFGEVSVEPPLNQAEIEYLDSFARSRRMDRELGPYFVDGRDEGPGPDKIYDHNCPPVGQPGLWCQWVPEHNGTVIQWDGGEKFYNAQEWMKYIIDHFLKPDCLAKDTLLFLQANHICSGEIFARGEEIDDTWYLIVENNKVFTAPQKVNVGAKEAVDWDTVGGKSAEWGYRARREERERDAAG